MIEPEDNQATGPDGDQTETSDEVMENDTDDDMNDDVNDDVLMEESNESSGDEAMIESGESGNSSTFDVFDATGKSSDAITTEEEFLRNINKCMTIYEFSGDVFVNFVGKANKKHALELLIDYVEEAKEPFSDQIHAFSFIMFETNCFRSVALPSKTLESAVDESEDVLDPAWYHHELVYRFFFEFLSSPGFQDQTAVQYINKEFIIKLLKLFDSSDVREREALIPILHRIYVRSVSFRAFIRHQINHIFLAFVHEKKQFNGIAELLKFVLSFINGLKSPIKQEHITFLERVLLPLYKAKSLKRYHIELKACVSKFIEKESRFKEMFMRYLLKYWPKSSASNEMLFLGDLEGICISMNQTEFKNAIAPLFKQLNHCTLSHHFQVAERALSFWNNFMFMMHVSANVAEILPIVAPCLIDVATTHWHANVRSVAAIVLKWFMEKHENLFTLYEQTLDKRVRTEMERNEKHRKFWETIEQQAQANMDRTNLD